MKHWLARTARGTLLTIIAEIFARTANTLFFLIITWYSGEQEASTYVLGFTFSTFLLPLSLAGLDQLHSREIARTPEQSSTILGNFLLARLISSVLCFIGLSLWLLGPYGFSQNINLVILLIGATIIPDSLIGICQAHLISHQRVGWIAILGAITGGAKLLFGSTMLLIGGGALTAASVVLLTAIIAFVLHFWLICRQIEWPTISFAPDFWKTQGRAELPMYLVGILTTIEGSFDSLLLSRSGNPISIGVFAAAMLVINALQILPVALRQILIPILTTTYQQARERAYDMYTQSHRYLLIITLAITIPLMLVADRLLPILYHDHFLATIPVFQIIIWSFVTMTLTIPNGRMLLVTGRQSITVPIQFAATVVNVGLNLALQPTLDANGAAIARVVSSSLVFLLTLWVVQRSIHRWSIFQQLGGTLIAGAVLGLMLFGLRWLGVHWIVATFAGLLSYAAALYIFRGVSTTEIQHLMALVQQRFGQRRIKHPL